MRKKMTKLFKTLKYASVVMLSLLFICITSLTNAYADPQHQPIGSLQYPIGTYSSDFYSTDNLYPFKYQKSTQEGTDSYRILLLDLRYLKLVQMLKTF